MNMGNGEVFKMKNFEGSVFHLYSQARMEEDRGAFKILTDKPTGKRSLGRPRHR
jgi:hypothetical protein